MKILKAYARMKECFWLGVANNALHRARINRARSFALTLSAIFCVAFLPGCGGGGGGTAITLEVTPKNITLDEGESQIFIATLGNDTNNKGVTWTLTGSGCAGSGCGTLTNITTASVTYTAPTGLTTGITASLEAASNAHMGTNLTVSITIVLPVTFPTNFTWPNGANGAPYSTTITATGGVPAIEYSLGSGSLPAGLSLNSSGTILGTPSSHGTSTFTINATDNGGMTPNSVVKSPTYTITVNPAPPLAIPTSTMPGGLVNTKYSAAIVPAGPGGRPPYTWSITSGTLPPGLTLSTSGGVISGTPTTTGVYRFFPQVTDSAIPSQTANSAAGVTITVTNVPPLQSVTPTLPTGDVAVAYTSTLKATGGVQPYTWSIASGQLPSGLNLDGGTGIISGTPILATTANFAVQVTDASSNVSAPQSLSIVIATGTASTNELINGPYSFLFHGFDADGNVVIAGNFNADGSGNIAGGQLDSNRFGGTLGVFTGSTFVGTYTVGGDGRGTMQLVVTNSKGAIATFNYLLALYSNGSIAMIENDTMGSPQSHGSGTIKPVIGGTLTPSSFSGNYVFELDGQDHNNKPEVLVGVVHADGSSLLSPGTMDMNDAGVYTPALALSGNFQVVGSNNKGAVILTFQLPNSAQVQLVYAFYFVSSKDIFCIAIDPTDTTHPRLAGELFLQQPSASFTADALNGISVATGTGLDGSNSSVFAGLLTGLTNNSVNTANVSYDQNDGGTVSTFTNPAPGSFTPDPSANGRFALTGLGDRISAAYLTAPNQGLLIGSDAAVTFGQLDAQTSVAPFNSASILGGYTLSAPATLDAATVNFLGQWNSPNGTGSIQGVVDAVDNLGNATANRSVTGTTYAITGTTTGRGTMTTNSAAGIPTNLVIYVVSPSSFRAISADSNPGKAHPLVFDLDH